MAKTYVVLDLETTGLDYQSEQITEIGAIKIDESFNEIDRFHTMVALEEGRELPEFITKLTGITAADLEGAPTESEALEKLNEFIGGSIVVAQNAPFDLSFISRGGIEPERFFCTRAMARFVEPELSASLKDVANRNAISLEGHHRALNDVEATIEVFRLYLPHVGRHAFENIVQDSVDRPLKFKPKNAIVRTVHMVALDNTDLIRLVRAFPEDHDMFAKLGNIIDRAMKGRD
ncbi:3'-5' exonuclease [Bacillus sp. L381]|uniref:3'-5' exonuclease n=1 Tax=Bacillus TaxID=1386 RepID=UPI001BA9B2A2|nr:MULTISPECIES: 3'-5' exonuclease [Bacillus]MCR9040814.1 3'-5' exonuclease [Bacillus velezensis]QUN08764.1 3'-5' exonuclease [Bacillus amyloliquefaciens]QYM81836.1 3'-5' exonuclease [Bacillus sp. 7D3]QZY10982.1 3'-5' exonuclease [Bacillus amyloliquefaciens]WIX20884.1 3'-5' exonuclease [Bacillus sp. L381]